MSWMLAFLGFAVLIILHEAGHFFAAKAVGMRVERFSLFFPPLIARRKKGETEYAIGAIPLGGYVKITGMNPAEEIPPEHAHRAYYRQPVWKRIFVIGAGPAVNIALAFAILAGLFWSNGVIEPPLVVGAIEKGTPAATTLKPGDRVLAVDGRPLTGDWAEQRDQVGKLVGAHKGTPVAITVQRNGTETTVRGTTFYDPDPDVKRYRYGFGYDNEASRVGVGPVRASGLAVQDMWRVTSTTVSTIAQIFVPEKREEIGSVVGGYNETRKAFELDAHACVADPRADLALARRDQPVPVPAARRGPHLLGAGREGARPPDPVQRDGARRVRGLRARDHVVLRRRDERHRPNSGRDLADPVASPHGGLTRRDDR